MNDLRSSLALLLMIAAGEPDAEGRAATVIVTTVTRYGVVVTVRPKWPLATRVAAITAAREIAAKITRE